MLASIRKALTSWPVLLLLGIIVVAFAVTGIGDPFGSKGTSPGGNLAKVGDTAINEVAFDKQFERIMRRARETNPGITPQQVVREGGVGQVLDGMIGGAAIEDFAAKQGVTASNRAVEGAIASIDAFRVAGKFDDATYKRLLSQNQMTERELKDGLRSDLIKRQLLVPVGSAAQVPRMMAIPYARLLLDVHQGEGAVLPPATVPTPNEADVTAYYAANRATFTLPERRGFRYALLDGAAIAASVAVSDDEVRKYYDANRESFGAVEQRRLSQVVLPDEAKARAFIAAVRGGEKFTAAAEKAGFKASDTDLGLLSRDKFAAASSPGFADTVFLTAAGGVAGPVKTDFGWNVVQVAAIVAPKGRDFASLKGEITTKLRAEKGEAALGDAVASIEDGFTSGKSFADAVAQRKLTPVTVPPITSGGRSLTPGLTLAPATAPVLAKVFDADPADGPSVVEISKGQFAVVELGQIISPTPVPLAQIRPQVVAALTTERAAKLGQMTADAIVAEVTKGAKLADVMKRRGLAAPKPIAGRRADVGGAKVPPALSTFLAMAAGSTRAMPGPGGSTVILHKDRILPGDLAAAPPLLEATRQQLAQLASDEISAAFAASIERQVGVKRYPNAIAAASRRIVGETDPAAK